MVREYRASFDGVDALARADRLAADMRATLEFPAKYDVQIDERDDVSCYVWFPGAPDLISMATKHGACLTPSDEIVTDWPDEYTP